MKEKVAVVLSYGNYAESVKDGAKYISVDYTGRNYGGASPCDSEEEVKSSVKHAVSVIENHGDIAVVSDQRAAQQKLF